MIELHHIHHVITTKRMLTYMRICVCMFVVCHVQIMPICLSGPTVSIINSSHCADMNYPKKGEAAVHRRGSGGRAEEDIQQTESRSL